MANQVVPDTDSISVACMATAWDIVRIAHGSTSMDEMKSARYLRLFATEVRQVYLHLLQGDAIPEAEKK